MKTACFAKANSTGLLCRSVEKTALKFSLNLYEIQAVSPNNQSTSNSLPVFQFRLL